MSIWVVIILLGLIKIPIAGLLLWVPFREDHAMNVPIPADEDDGDQADGSDGDGGSKIRWRGMPPRRPSPSSPCPSFSDSACAGGGRPSLSRGAYGVSRRGHGRDVPSRVHRQPVRRSVRRA
jgi:hypothetical protein